MKFLVSFSLLCLLSTSSYAGSAGGAASAPELSKRGVLGPFKQARVSSSKPKGDIQTASTLMPRDPFFIQDKRDLCLPGTLPCLINDRCCPGECCLDDTCCDIVETCHNDLSDSVGPSYCCKRYTEATCDNGGCMPFDGNCCGGGNYCEWDHYCTDTGCCPKGKLCNSSGDDDDDDGDSGRGGGDNDDKDDKEDKGDKDDKDDNDGPGIIAPTTPAEPSTTTARPTLTKSSTSSSSRSSSSSLSSDSDSSSTSTTSESSSSSSIELAPTDSDPPAFAPGASDGEQAPSVGAMVARVTGFGRVVVAVAVVASAMLCCV